MKSLDVQYETIGTNISCVRLIGALDIAGVQEANLRFTSFTTTPRKPVIVDLSEVTMITSMGLGLLITNAKSLMLHKLPIILLNPQPNVEKVIQLSGLLELLPIEHDMDSAVARCSRPPM